MKVYKIAILSVLLASQCSVNADIEIVNSTGSPIRVDYPGVTGMGTIAPNGGICPCSNPADNKPNWMDDISCKGAYTLYYTYGDWPNKWNSMKEVCDQGPQKGQSMIELLKKANCWGQPCKIRQDGPKRFTILRNQ